MSNQKQITSEGCALWLYMGGHPAEVTNRFKDAPHRRAYLREVLARLRSLGADDAYFQIANWERYSDGTGDYTEIDIALEAGNAQEETL